MCVRAWLRCCAVHETCYVKKGGAQRRTGAGAGGEGAQVVCVVVGLYFSLSRGGVLRACMRRVVVARARSGAVHVRAMRRDNFAHRGGGVEYGTSSGKDAIFWRSGLTSFNNG